MILWALLFVLCHPGGLAEKSSIREEIAENIINRCQYDTIPMVGVNPLTIFVGFNLFNIHRAEAKFNFVEITAFLFMSWKDKHLSWNDPYSPWYGIEQVTIPARGIWTPDMDVYTTYGVPDKYSAERVVVDRNGTVVYIPQMRIPLSCDLSKLLCSNKATCSIQVGTWYHGSKEVVLTSSQDFILSKYVPSSSYEVLNATQKVRRVKYECCPDPYDVLELSFTFRRKENNCGGYFP